MVEAMENVPFAALSDEDLKRDMQTLSEEIRSIKEQLRDDASGLYPRGDDWRRRAVFRRDCLRRDLRDATAEWMERTAPKRDEKKQRRQAGAIAQAQAVEAKSLAKYGARFYAAAQRVLPPEVLAQVRAAMQGGADG